nr:unnamed protein product [Callosobruchus chinensis]
MLQKRRANFWTDEENKGETEAVNEYSSDDERHLLFKRGREITDEPVESTSRRLGVKDIDEFYRNMTWTKVKKKNKKKKKKPDQEITTKTWIWPESKDEETKQLWQPFNWDVEHTRKINETVEVTEKTAYQHDATTGNKTKVGIHLIEWPELFDQETSSRESHHEFNESSWKSYNWDLEHNETIWRLTKSGLEQVESSSEHTGPAATLEAASLIHNEPNEEENVQTTSPNDYQQYNETFWRTYKWNIDHNATFRSTFEWNLEHNETFRKMYNWNMERYHINSENTASTPEYNKNTSSTQPEESSSLSTETSEDMTIELPTEEDNKEFNATFWTVYNWNIEHNTTFRRIFEWNMEHNGKFRTMYKLNMERLKNSQVSSTSGFSEETTVTELEMPSSEFKEASEENSIDLTTQRNDKEFNVTYWRHYNWKIEHDKKFRKTFEWNMEHNENFRTMYKLNMERLKNYNQSEYELSSTSGYNEEAKVTELETSSSESKEASAEDTIELTTQENQEFNVTYWKQYNWKIEHDAKFRKTFEWNMEHNENFRTMYKLNMERLKNYNQSESELSSTSGYNEEAEVTELGTSSSESKEASAENTIELTTQENQEFNATFWRQYVWNIEHNATFRETFEWNMEHNEKFRKIYNFNMERLRSYNQSTSEGANVTESGSTTVVEKLEEIATKQHELTVPHEATAVTELDEKETFQLHSIANELLNPDNFENTLSTPGEAQTLGEPSEAIDVLGSTSSEAEGIITEEHINQEATEAENGFENVETDATGLAETAAQHQQASEESSEISLRPELKVESNMYQDDQEGKVNELDELEKKRLFSIADYLLDPKNFEATLRTTIVTDNAKVQSTVHTPSVQTKGASKIFIVTVCAPKASNKLLIEE